MNGYIEQKIIELQNSKTATEITQNAKYFINILAENESLKEQLENTKSRIYISYEKGVYGDTDYAMLFYVSPNKTIFVLEEFTEEKYGKKVKEVAEARLKELEAQ